MKSSVAAGLVGSVLETAERRYGLAPAALLATGGLHADEVRDPSLPVPTVAFERVLRAVLMTTGDEAFGVRWAESVDLRSQGFWGYALLSSPTLRERLLRGVRYVPLRGPVRMSLRVEGSHALIEIDPHGFAVDIAPVIVDMTIASGHVQLAHRLPRPLRDVSLSLAQRERPHHREFRAMAHHGSIVFNAGVTFEATGNVTRFAADDLELPLGGDPYMSELAMAQLETQLAEREATNPSLLLDRVQLRISARLHEDASLERVAADLQVSARTLQRMLDAQGASFHALTADVRRVRAISHLTGTDESIERIAEHLGYGDTSTFRRAFRRWTGHAPTTFREAHRKAEAEMSHPPHARESLLEQA